MTITKIVRRPGDIQGKINPRATTTISRTSTETTLEREEVLPKTEMISINMSQEEDQVIDTGHMVLDATSEMLLHTEEMEEEGITPKVIRNSLLV